MRDDEIINRIFVNPLLDLERYNVLNLLDIKIEESETWKFIQKYRNQQVKYKFITDGSLFIANIKKAQLFY